MTIVAKDVAFIKTSGEAVMVLEYPNAEGQVTVRRPVAAQDGVRHVVESFHYFELETLDEQRKRFVAEREEVMKKYGPQSEATPSGDLGFGSN